MEIRASDYSGCGNAIFALTDDVRSFFAANENEKNKQTKIFRYENLQIKKTLNAWAASGFPAIN